LTSRNPCLNQVPFRREKCLPLSSGGTTTEETCPLEWTTKTHCQNWYGRWQYNRWTTITTCLSSSTEHARSSTPTEPSR
jgi:hypothetical protein